MKHTPGPWHTREGKKREIIFDKKGWEVAEVTPYFGDRITGEGKANARLIAAAPDLLEALQACDDAGLFDLATSQKAGIPDKFRKLARAAIAKATGD